MLRISTNRVEKRGEGSGNTSIFCKEKKEIFRLSFCTKYNNEQNFYTVFHRKQPAD